MNSIDDLKSTINKKGGVAFANRFQVFFTPPTANMKSLLSQSLGSLVGSLIDTAVSGASPKNLIPDPRDTSILCESVTLPGRQIATLDYIADKQAVKIPYTVINEDVTMSFLLTNDYHMKKMFDDWTSAVVDLNSYKAGYKKDFCCDVVIQQLNQQNKPVYGVRLENAFPTTVTSVQYDSNSENTINKLSVTLSYDNYVPEGALQSLGSTVGTFADILG